MKVCKDCGVHSDSLVTKGQHMPGCKLALRTTPPQKRPDYRQIIDNEAGRAATVDVTEAAAYAKTKFSVRVVDVEHNGHRWTIEHDTLGFRVTKNGKTAWHELACDRTSTLPQALSWLAYAMSTAPVTP